MAEAHLLVRSKDVNTWFYVDWKWILGSKFVCIIPVLGLGEVLDEMVSTRIQHTCKE